MRHTAVYLGALALLLATAGLCAAEPQVQGSAPASEQPPPVPHRTEVLPLHGADPRDVPDILVQFSLPGVSSLISYDLTDSLIVTGTPDGIALIRGALPLLGRPPLRISVAAEFYTLEPGALSTESLTTVPGVPTRRVFEGGQAQRLASVLQGLAQRKLARLQFSPHMTTTACSPAPAQSALSPDGNEVTYLFQVSPRVSPYFGTGAFGHKGAFQGSVQAHVTLFEGRKVGATLAGRMVNESVTVPSGDSIAFWMQPTEGAQKHLVVLLRFAIAHPDPVAPAAPNR